MAQPAALTGMHPTTSFQLCLTLSAFSSFAMHCPAPSSSSPTLSFCWQCADHVRPSSSMCHHRPRPPMHTLSLSRSEDISVASAPLTSGFALGRVWAGELFKGYENEFIFVEPSCICSCMYVWAGITRVQTADIKTLHWFKTQDIFCPVHSYMYLFTLLFHSCQ